MRYLFLAIFLLLALLSKAQDKETIARSHYMAAESAYNERKYSDAIQELTETEQALGSSNAKVKYLLVKSYVELKRYDEAKKELALYFDLAGNNKGGDKYNEMTLLLVQLDKLAREHTHSSYYAGVINNHVSELDKMFKHCYSYMQNERKQQDAKVDAVTYKDYSITCYLSGKIIEPNYSKSTSLKNVEKVIKVLVSKRDALYDIEIKYHGDIKQTKIFWSIAGEECADKMVDVVIKIANTINSQSE